MPERINIPRPEPRSRDPYAWLGEALQAVVLVAIAFGIGAFAQVALRVRDRIGLSGDRGWLLLIGLAVIELYLAFRAIRQVRKARVAFHQARPRRSGQG